ncbi:MAG: sensor histidine kinase [Rhodanobacteraceae bacterium]
MMEPPRPKATPHDDDDRSTVCRAAAEDARVEDVLGDLAHAVANSLNTVVMAAQLARVLIADHRADEAVKPLGQVEQESLRVARLLQDGRMFASFRIGESRARVDIGALLRDCSGAFATRGAVHVEAATDAQPVHGNPEALRRLVVELLDNAFEFGASRVDVALAFDGSGQLACIDFQDDGPGISVAPVRIFNPFFSTRPEEHSGLGLALAARIVAAHGGAISVDPDARGAWFRVTLPTTGSG